MDLPVQPPVSPMLAKLARTVPEAPGMLYEPKWDGFRCIAFRDGDEVVLGSRNERPLTRYFPEVADALRAELPERCVVDGEIVIASPDGRLDFDSLLQRIHPAASRVAMLARATPASFVAFDLLALGDEDLRDVPQGQRRGRLEAALAGVSPPVYVTPMTTDPVLAAEWFSAFEGAGLDGVVAKPPDLPYCEDQRVLLKVKHERTADCVVAGFRWHKNSTGTDPLVGSLLLGLHDDKGDLHHVGVAAAFPMQERRRLVDTLAPYRDGAGEGHPWARWAEASVPAAPPESTAPGAPPENTASGAPPEGTGRRLPGGQSRWNAGRDLSFELLRPELVVEVRYDHLQSDRFRHATQFVRFRTDREPASCAYDQLEVAPPSELARIFA